MWRTGVPRNFAPHLQIETASLTMIAPIMGGVMKLYRVNKLAKPGGVIIKKKDILATSDKHAVDQAADSADCPICDVLRDGEKVGSIL